MSTRKRMRQNIDILSSTQYPTLSTTTPYVATCILCQANGAPYFQRITSSNTPPQVERNLGVVNAFCLAVTMALGGIDVYGCQRGFVQVTE